MTTRQRHHLYIGNLWILTMVIFHNKFLESNYQRDPKGTTVQPEHWGLVLTLVLINVPLQRFHSFPIISPLSPMFCCWISLSHAFSPWEISKCSPHLRLCFVQSSRQQWRHNGHTIRATHVSRKRPDAVASEDTKDFVGQTQAESRTAWIACDR